MRESGVKGIRKAERNIFEDDMNLLDGQRNTDPAQDKNRLWLRPGCSPRGQGNQKLLLLLTKTALTQPVCAVCFLCARH